MGSSSWSTGSQSTSAAMMRPPVFWRSTVFWCAAETIWATDRRRPDGSYGFFAPENGWSLAARDVRSLRELEGARHPDLPYFLLGHSMGSFLTRTYLILWPGTVSGAVLMGTGQEPAPLIALGRRAAALECRRLGPRGVSPLVHSLSLGAYNRRFRPNRTASDWLSRDPAEVDAFLADPLCQFRPTVSLFRDMMGGAPPDRPGGTSWSGWIPPSRSVFSPVVRTR